MKGEVLASGDVPNDAGGAVDAEVEERRGDGSRGSLARAVLAGGATDTHQRRARVRHHRADIGEIDVDEAGEGDDVADAADALAEDVVGEEEGVLHGERGVDRGEETIVGNDDQGIDVAAEALDGVHRLVVALATLKLEGHGDDADGEDTSRFGHARDDGSSAGAGATTHTGGHEHHVRARERLLDGLPALLGRLLADLGVAARAQATGQLAANLDVAGRGHRRGGHGLRKSGDGCCGWVSIFFRAR